MMIDGPRAFDINEGGEAARDNCQQTLCLLKEMARMSARHIITFLLILAISSAMVVHPPGARANLRADVTDQPPLLPAEEQEARDIVKRFSERLHATNDFGLIIDELFVADFSERLRPAPTNWLPWILLDKPLTTSASSSELRRYYVASMNFYALYFRLHEVAERQKKQSEDSDSEKERELTIADVASPEVVAVLLSNPTLAELAELSKDDKSDERTKEDDSRQPAESGNPAPAAGATAKADSDSPTEKSEIRIIKSLAQLDAVSTTLEKANELLRPRLETLLDVSPVPPDSEEITKQATLQGLGLTTLDEGEYGYPQATPVIDVSLIPFSLRLIKADGRFKILSVSLYCE